jgi:hypothetical protein
MKVKRLKADKYQHVFYILNLHLSDSPKTIFNTHEYLVINF